MSGVAPWDAPLGSLLNGWWWGGPWDSPWSSPWRDSWSDPRRGRPIQCEVQRGTWLLSEGVTIYTVQTLGGALKPSQKLLPI